MKRLLALLVCCTVLLGSMGVAADSADVYPDETQILIDHSSTKDMDDMITASYPQEILLKHISFGNTVNTDTTVSWLNNLFPIECSRTFEDDSLPYCIYKLQEGGYLYIFFYGIGATNRYASCAFVVKEALKKSDFNRIRPGKTLKDVERIDSGAKLYNLLH